MNNHRSLPERGSSFFCEIATHLFLDEQEDQINFTFKSPGWKFSLYICILLPGNNLMTLFNDPILSNRQNKQNYIHHPKIYLWHIDYNEC